jgi:hydroxyacylglutathione hydrolase
MKTWSTSGKNNIIRVLSGRSNVFLLTNGNTNVLVDTSPGFMWGTLQQRLSKLGIDQIDLLILTHSHFDHAANAARIQKKYRARVIIHESEARYLATGDNILPMGTNNFAKLIVKTFSDKFRSFARYQPCNADVTVASEFSLSGYGFNAILMHTPGHTAGSMSLIIDNEIALVGDTLFGVFPRTVFPPFASDSDQLMTSWEKLLNTTCILFLPSHGTANSRSLLEKEYKRKKSTVGHTIKEIE